MSPSSTSPAAPAPICAPSRPSSQRIRAGASSITTIASSPPRASGSATGRIDRNRPNALSSREDGAIDVSFAVVDLARTPEQALDGDIDLVSAAAFFDLVSQQWIERFCVALAARRLPLYAVLTYTGSEVWTPPHPADAPALAAFHAHQGGDKGFGPAAGPNAAPLLATALRRHGYLVSTAQSPWRLGRADKALIEATADGAAAAIAETGRLDSAIVEDWRLSRRRAVACEISHIDLFAIPA